jgi:hypothetical protein
MFKNTQYQVGQNRDRNMEIRVYQEHKGQMEVGVVHKAKDPHTGGTVYQVHKGKEYYALQTFPGDTQDGKQKVKKLQQMNLMTHVLAFFSQRPSKFQEGEAVQRVGQEKIMVVNQVIRKGKNYIIQCEWFSEEVNRTITRNYDETELVPLDWFQFERSSTVRKNKVNPD